VPTTPGVAGTPIGARVLRIAIDYDVLEMQHVPDHKRLLMMQSRVGSYDPALLEQFATALGF
jgi:response regulator RpfG family c-di-GMP phosphodiesterase